MYAYWVYLVFCFSLTCFFKEKMSCSLLLFLLFLKKWRVFFPLSCSICLFPFGSLRVCPGHFPTLKCVFQQNTERIPSIPLSLYLRLCLVISVSMSISISMILYVYHLYLYKSPSTALSTSISTSISILVGDLNPSEKY